MRFEANRAWLSVIASVALGPIFLVLGYSAGLMFDLAAGAYFLVCVAVVPLLIYAAGRFKFVVWQVAILSLVISVLADNLRLRAIQRSSGCGSSSGIRSS